MSTAGAPEPEDREEGADQTTEPESWDWWRKAVVYQVYPRSFADSDGDGVGDLQGLIEHLDHLAGVPGSLGIDAIWLSPIYPSPGRDLGYDITDHTSIDPLFGTAEDFDRLIAEAHARGMRLIMDLVLNHTSDRHPWFEASRVSRAGEFADWYLWRDPAGRDRAGRPVPPNNWLSFFGGSAWSWEPRREQFYLHTFLAEQPDLDWRHPAVEEAQFAVARGWLDRGVDGLRLDVFNAFLKDPALRSNPSRPGPHRRPWDRQAHVFDKDQPDLVPLLARFRAMVDQRPGRMTVGELFEGTPARAASLASGNHQVFDFGLTATPWTADALRAAIDVREAAFGPRGWPTVVLSNHDQPRHVSRFAESAAVGDDTDPLAKAAAVLLLTLRGAAYLYYGEELGARNIAVTRGDAIDPPARRAGVRFPWWNRDQCRAPMPWDGTPGRGFTTGRPWLPLAPDGATRNAATQAGDPDSVLACYRRMLRARRTLAPLHAGGFRWVVAGHPEVLAWERHLDSERVLVVCNTAAQPVATRPQAGGPGGTTAWAPYAGTHVRLPAGFSDGAEVTLRPFEAFVAVPSA